MLEKSFENREKKKAWDLYLTKFPDMQKENYISFDDFWTGLKTKQQNEEKTVEEIRQEFTEVKKIHQGRGK